MDGNTPLGHNCGVAFDSSGALYVADAANQRIQRFPASAFSWLASPLLHHSDRRTPPTPSPRAPHNLI